MHGSHKGRLEQSTVWVGAWVVQTRRLTGLPCHLTAHRPATPPRAGS